MAVAAAFGASEGGDRGSAASPSRALPGSGESVGTKWPPLPPQGCSAGTAPTGEPASSAVEGARGGRVEDGLSLPSRNSALGLGDGSQRRTSEPRAQAT